MTTLKELPLGESAWAWRSAFVLQRAQIRDEVTQEVEFGLAFPTECKGVTSLPDTFC